MRPRVPRLGVRAGFSVRAVKTSPVRANQVLLVWALEMRFRNALDARRAGGEHRVAAAGAGPGPVSFSVSDDGPGIPPPSASGF